MFEANPNDMTTSEAVALITKPTQGAACEGDTRVTFELFRKEDLTVVGSDLQLVKESAVLGEDVLVVDPDTVTEDDGVRHLHHGGLHVERHHQLLLVAVVDLLLKELAQSLGIHAGGIDDLSLLELVVLLENGGGTVSGLEADGHASLLGHDVALLGAEEVLVGHAADDSPLGVLLPGPHGRGSLLHLLGVLLDRNSSATVRVT